MWIDWSSRILLLFRLFSAILQFDIAGFYCIRKGLYCTYRSKISEQWAAVTKNLSLIITVVQLLPFGSRIWEADWNVYGLQRAKKGYRIQSTSEYFLNTFDYFSGFLSVFERFNVFE